MLCTSLVNKLYKLEVIFGLLLLLELVVGTHQKRELSFGRKETRRKFQGNTVVQNVAQPPNLAKDTKISAPQLSIGL